MHDQQKLTTLLQMITDLSKRGRFPVNRLARKYDISERTIYRYFELLRKCGFQLEPDSEHRYRIIAADEVYQRDGITFRLEEAGIIKDALLAVHDTHPLRNTLLAKLFAHSELDAAAELVYNQLVGQTIATLTHAINNQWQVRLEQYQSMNSQTIADRIVEPIGFVNNMRYLLAYEHARKKVLQYKADRIGGVKVLDRPFAHAHLHTHQHPDAFGMNAIPVTEVHLRLHPRAAALLQEEFPLAQSGLQPAQSTKKAEWRGTVKGYEGIGRFILGLPGEVEVVAPAGLADYLTQQISQYRLTVQ